MSQEKWKQLPDDTTSACPVFLDGEEKTLVQLFSLLFRVQVFLRLSEVTHSCSGVCVVLELWYILYTTLKVDSDSQMYDPRKPVSQNRQRRGIKKRGRMGQMMTSVWVTGQGKGSRERRHANKYGRRTRRRVSKCVG